MCSSRFTAPPPPPPIQVPKVEMPNVVAPTMTQTAPKPPVPEQGALIKRRGKRGMVIQLGTQGGTNVPGM